jgi:hypothetical protein
VGIPEQVECLKGEHTEPSDAVEGEEDGVIWERHDCEEASHAVDDERTVYRAGPYGCDILCGCVNRWQI